MSAYADDMLIVYSACDRDMIVASLQTEVDKVVAWSDKARLTFNSSKYETAFFSLDCAEAAWQPNIPIDGKRIFCNLHQISLGVTYVQQHTFGEPGRKLCQSMSGRINLLRALGGTTWGWQTLDCRHVYVAVVRGVLEYAAAAWEPWLSATITSILQKVQLETARDNTSLFRSTTVEAVLAEYQLPSISTRFQKISLLRTDEWAHRPPADDRRQTFFTACR